MNQYAQKSTVSLAEGSKAFSIFDASIAPEEPIFLSKTSLIQLGYGIWVNLSSIVTGLLFGFTSATMPNLRADPVVRINLDQESWIASSVVLGAPVGSLCGGVLMDKIGRKPMMVIGQVPVIVGWILIAYSETAGVIIIGRIITSLGLGMILVTPRTYATEISLPSMRGVLGALPNFFMSIGMMIVTGLGILTSWRTLCTICGVYSFLLMICYGCLPETPYFVLLHSPEDAEDKLRLFRSKSYDVVGEMKTLIEFKQENNIRRMSFQEKIAALFTPAVCRPFGLTIAYIAVSQIAGISVISMWLTEMLQICNSSIAPSTGTIIINFVRMVAGFFASMIVFKVRRRTLAITSAVGTGCTCLGVCMYLNTATEEKSIVPFGFFCGNVIFCSIGYYILPMMLMLEVLPLQHKGLLCGVSITIMNMLVFGMNKCYPYMREIIGLDYIMLIFGIVSLFGAILLFYILPETSELTLQEIEEYYNKRRPVMVASRKMLAHSMSRMSGMDLERYRSRIAAIKSEANAAQRK